MLKNAPKRTGLMDAVDLFASGSNEVATVENIDINKLHTFKGHPFRLYEGERLDDMVESIKEHGIITPLIVRKMDKEYEILAGHNRKNAASIAGLTEVPCIVKEEISDELALIYVIETNLMQRSFTDMLPSEKASVLKMKYDETKCQGKRNDILKELAVLNGKKTEDYSDDSRKDIANEYGLSSTTVARLLRINDLIEPFKRMLDNGNLALLSAVELSYIKEQVLIYDFILANNCKLPVNAAVELRRLDKDNDINNETLTDLFIKPKKVSNEKKVSISSGIYTKFFKNKKKEEVNQIVDEAVRYYCENILGNN